MYTDYARSYFSGVFVRLRSAVVVAGKGCAVTTMRVWDEEKGSECGVMFRFEF